MVKQVKTRWDGKVTEAARSYWEQAHTSHPVELNAADCAQPITDTDSVL